MSVLQHANIIRYSFSGDGSVRIDALGRVRYLCQRMLSHWQLMNAPTPVVRHIAACCSIPHQSIDPGVSHQKQHTQLIPEEAINSRGKVLDLDLSKIVSMCDRPSWFECATLDVERILCTSFVGSL